MGGFKTGVFKMGKIKTGFAENLGHCCHTSVIITFYSVCSSACKLAGWYMCAAGKGEGGRRKKMHRAAMNEQISKREIRGKWYCCQISM